MDVTNCDREPIHIPAALQPHSVLLVLRQHDWQILQVSQNTDEYFGRSLEELLNQPVTEILTAAPVEAMEQCLTAAFEAVKLLRTDLCSLVPA
ncbi:MAG: hypothetical protein AAFX01_00950 [Cyanobacteria bacterium J06638_28]